MLENTYTLENGIKIPKLGLGTWFINDSKVFFVFCVVVFFGRSGKRSRKNWLSHD